MGYGSIGVYVTKIVSTRRKQMEEQEKCIYITTNSYDNYKTRLTAGDLTQSSCSYDNDLAYDLDISL